MPRTCWIRLRRHDFDEVLRGTYLCWRCDATRIKVGPLRIPGGPWFLKSWLEVRSWDVPIGVPVEVRADERGVFTATRYLNNPLADHVLDAIKPEGEPQKT